MSEISRRDFLKITLAGIAAVVGYEVGTIVERNILLNQIKKDTGVLPPTNGITQESPTEPSPTKSPDIVENKSVAPDKAGAATETPYAEITRDNFYKGPFYPASPFGLRIPGQVVPGYGSLNIDIDTPMTIEDYESQANETKKATFEDYFDFPAASLGYITNDPNTKTHFVVLIHSGQVKPGQPLPGETFREWSRYKDPTVMIGKNMGLVQDNAALGKVNVDMKITDLTVIGEEKFYDGLKYVNGQKPQFFAIDSLGIPPASQKDSLCITFVYCVDEFNVDSKGNPVVNQYGIIQPKAGTLTNRRGLLTLEAKVS